MKKAIVIGMRLSGTAAAALLEREGYEVFRCDDDPSIAPESPGIPL